MSREMWKAALQQACGRRGESCVVGGGPRACRNRIRILRLTERDEGVCVGRGGGGEGEEEQEVMEGEESREHKLC